jgi:hypothetical protein
MAQSFSSQLQNQQQQQLSTLQHLAQGSSNLAAKKKLPFGF